MKVGARQFIVDAAAASIARAANTVGEFVMEGTLSAKSSLSFFVNAIAKILTYKILCGIIIECSGTLM